MGNSCMKGAANDGGRGQPSVKVVLADGTVEEFKRPITVAELMLDYPQHFVCHSSALTSTLQKKSILPADVELESGRLYYLLASEKLKGALSPPKDDADSIGRGKPNDLTLGEPLKRAKSQTKSDDRGNRGNFAGDGQPFSINQWRGLGADKDRVRVQDVPKIFEEDCETEFEDEDHEEPIISYSTPDLRSMYSAPVSQPALMRCNSWKPRLETINEVSTNSRRKIQDFVRGRGPRGSKSQVHNYLMY